MAAQDIIIRPIITEKSMSGMTEKKYTFEVKKDRSEEHTSELQSP